MCYQINIFMRSLVFSIFISIFTFFYSFFCVLARPLPFHYRYKIIMAWTHTIVWTLKKICGIHYHVTGLENLPKDRVGIILSKHQSTWETFFLPGLFHQTAIILKRELLWVPFFGWGLAIIDPIAIDRKDKISAIEQIITQGKKCLQAGRWILVFPEGTRTAPGHVGKYRLGGARLATATNSFIVPIAHNAGRFWPKRGFIKKPGTIQVAIGPPIGPHGKTPEALMAEAKAWIETTMQKIDRQS